MKPHKRFHPHVCRCGAYPWPHNWLVRPSKCHEQERQWEEQIREAQAQYTPPHSFDVFEMLFGDGTVNEEPTHPELHRPWRDNS
jgi:hypothetical protein